MEYSRRGFFSKKLLLLDFSLSGKNTTRECGFTNNDLSHVKQKNTFQITLATKLVEKVVNGFCIYYTHEILVSTFVLRLWCYGHG